MQFKRTVVSLGLSTALVLTGCGITEEGAETTATEDPAQEAEPQEVTQENIESSLAKIETTKWNYNAEDDVYWQVGISYCENPADEKYETLGIFVPGAYMNGVENADGTYTCEVNTENTIGNYNAETAPIVIPVDTPGYSAMTAPTDYVASNADYTKDGIIYVSAGCRGRDAGAPAGVTDLKAAIRYIRYSEESIPGSTDRIFSFGMSGGGAQSALIGATGDSELYIPYLEAIGAVSGVSDAVAGSMCWCPITNLDYANEAYEWNLGVTRTGLDEDTQKLSDEMSETFAQYINELGLTDVNGNVLVLTESEEGIYQAGSYYDYIKEVIENSLNNFLTDTTFPYEANNNGGFASGMMRGERPEELPDGALPEGDMKPIGEEPKDEMKPDREGTQGEIPTGNQTQDITERDDIQRNITESGLTLSGSYETAQDYIDALNAENEWVTYDSVTNTATITNVADFVKALKNASKNVGAFDDLDAIQGENVLFGYGDGNGAHFDPIMAELLTDNESYAAAYAEDLEKTDAQGNTVAIRVNMYNPMYYLEDYYEGYQTSNVARYWRIRTGINQGDTALTTEINLALALESYGANVDFETVWGQGHVEAERTGDSTENFISWINECLN
ncbi:MAG: tannase [Lachnospiraceae bacterium]|nr:tannase [Lachnospiraceae bacterium]